MTRLDGRIWNECSVRTCFVSNNGISWDGPTSPHGEASLDPNTWVDCGPECQQSVDVGVMKEEDWVESYKNIGSERQGN